MVGRIIRFNVFPGKEAEMDRLAIQLMQDVRLHEPGAIYEVRKVHGQPRTYVYFMSFPDQASYDRYEAADYHQDMSPKAWALIDGDPVFEDLEGLA